MEREELFKLSRENVEWFKENYDCLKKEYDNKWVIIQNKKVIQSGSSFNDIMSVAKRHDPRTVMVEFIQSQPVAMFF